MTREDIIRLAMEYGFTGGFDTQGNLTFDAVFVEAVTEAVEREREHCAARAAIALLGTLQTTSDRVLHAIRHREEKK